MARQQQGAAADQRSTAELVKDLSKDLSMLVRKEIDLAKAELSEKGKKAGIGVGFFGGAGVFGFLALAALVTAAIIGLAEVVHAAVAAVILAAVLGVVAGIFAMTGKSKVQESTPPVEETAESVKEDVQWLKGQRR